MVQSPRSCEKQNPNWMWLPGTQVYGKNQAGTSEGDMLMEGNWKLSVGKTQDMEMQPRPWRLCTWQHRWVSACQPSGPLKFPVILNHPGVGSEFTYICHFYLLRPESHFRNISIQSGQIIVHTKHLYVKRLTLSWEFIYMEHVIPRDPQVHETLTTDGFLFYAHDSLVTDLYNYTVSFLDEKKTSLGRPLKQKLRPPWYSLERVFLQIVL